MEPIGGGKYKCAKCGYVYAPEKGDPRHGIEPGTKFEELPEDWRCPRCKQPQRFYVMRSPYALNKVKAVTPFHYNAPLVLLVCYDLDTVWKQPRDRMFRNYNSGEQDASIAATTMMYAAEELGVHSVWLRGFDAKTVSEVFELPENIIPVMMFAMGYPSEKSQPNTWHFKRMPLDAFVTEL